MASLKVYTGEDVFRALGLTSSGSLHLPESPGMYPSLSTGRTTVPSSQQYYGIISYAFYAMTSFNGTFFTGKKSNFYHHLNAYGLTRRMKSITSNRLPSGRRYQ